MRLNESIFSWSRNVGGAVCVVNEGIGVSMVRVSTGGLETARMDEVDFNDGRGWAMTAVYTGSSHIQE